MTISHEAPPLTSRVNVASIDRMIAEAVRPGVAMPKRATLVMHISALTNDVKMLLPEVPRERAEYERAQGLVLPRARPGPGASHYELWQYSLTLAHAAQDLLDVAQQEAGTHVPQR
ncbi:hypothetical protein [Streptomyces sp. NPDC087300]|uniref:hypothetical protein n=1 Tax=Streptomyces sp. NPDC087300 TaxID=3365780 RepID=UPI00381B90A2